ncbi:MAG: hypothetical protein QF362_01480 [Candidatus Woesearchaeota archaeon]|mgnify:FL=1|jgi:hypothetical protein|nr:hypothetical protein [Candidatus Woesearchaeota archaeon]MDP7506094.1 hypothetical protein [Candidatus Woesearchaeota archaeon]MDP7610418.1 hypothetical protein [Candidatus Woesearchaeota archaeon]|tara:strand:- start:6214 stop:6429 length:216 start_codon:yes stop_codon:yes gene_type:complete
METISLNLLQQIAEDIKFLKHEILNIKEDVNELKDFELEVKPEYITKLKRIDKEKGIPFSDMSELRKIIEG